jgi:hydroxymethylpyrimidine pyrophosphatase-like HAD family hydrolase
MLEGEIRERGQAVLDRFPGVAVEAYHIKNVIHAVHPNEITRNHEHLTKVSIQELPTLLDAPLPLGKLLFEGDHETLLQVWAFLDEQGWGQDYELIFSMPTLLEVTAKGARKGDMVRRLANRLGIAMEHVYCVGDESNDISMLTAAAEGFAPANCNAAVRECGATIVSHCNEDAIADVIAILDKKY